MQTFGLPRIKKKDLKKGRHILVVLLLATAISLVVTQYLAYAFNYHPNLGAPLAGKLYGPYKWMVWSIRFYGDYPLTFKKAYTLLGSGGIILFGLYIFLFAVSKRSSKGFQDLHGSAAFAKRKQIDKVGLLGADDAESVYVGGWQDTKGRLHYLRHGGPEHVLAFAPTRSGKGVGLVLPTLLSWPASVVTLDIKGENWELTAGWRKEHAGNVVLKFDPASPEGSCKKNPLDEIRLGSPYEVADVQNLVTMIVDPDGKGLVDHWMKTGHALLVGAVLHLLYVSKKAGRPATLLGVAELLSDPSRPVDDVFEEMMNTEHTPGGVHPVVASSARDMLNKAEQERSGVLSTAMSFLTLYRDPIVAANIESSDFMISDLMNHDQPVSLYLVCRPSDKDRLKPLYRLLINQIVRLLCERMDFGEGRAIKHYKHRLLLMLDEFPSLGRLEIFQESLAYFASYGLKAYLIAQDLSQLYAAYSQYESIISNCHIRAAYAPNKVETAELLSRMTGKTTVIKKSFSRSGNKYGAILGRVSESIQEVGRPLLTPDECMRLPGPVKDSHGDIVEAGDMLVFVAGHDPIYGKQILYFRDPVFDKRSKIKAPMESGRIEGDPAAAVATDAPTETFSEQLGLM